MTTKWIDIQHRIAENQRLQNELIRHCEIALNHLKTVCSVASRGECPVLSSHSIIGCLNMECYYVFRDLTNSIDELKGAQLEA